MSTIALGLATQIRTAGDMRDQPADEPLVSVSKQSIRRRVKRAREDLAEQTGDDYWHHLGYHDLRRTWTTSLRSADSARWWSATGAAGTT